MRCLRRVSLTAALLLLAASACSSEPGEQASAKVTPQPSSPEPASPVEPPEAATFEAFDPGNFGVDSAKLTHRFFPLTPGTRFTWEGSTQEGDEPVPHRVVFTVTDLTKVVNGVRTVVGWDRDYTDGKLEEAEIIFLAQDKDGNVWHFGQVVEVYDDEGAYMGTSAWLAGIDGAREGIMMKAMPQKGALPNSEGFAPPPFFWDDHARVYEVGQKTCVLAGCYDNVLVMDEFEPGKPGAHQLKYYAPGVGNVRVGFMGNDAEQETMELARVKQLTPEEMAEARAEALKIHNRGYMYGRTLPLEGTAAG